MPLSNITYEVDSGGVSGIVSLSPIIDDLLFEEVPADDVRGYIRTLNTEMVFRGSDYDFFYDNYEVSGTCSNLDFTIKLSGSTYYTGQLKLGSDRVRWDISNKKMFARLDQKRPEQCFLDDWEDTINLLTSTTKTTVQPFIGTFTEETCGPVSGGSPIEINGFFENNVSGCLTGPRQSYSLQRAYIEEVSPTKYNHYATWVSERVTVSCSGGSPNEPPGDGWILVSDNCPTNAVYGRAPDMVYIGEQSESTGKYWDNTYEVGGRFDEDGNAVANIDNGVLLKEGLESKAPACINNVRSNFFNINASGASPSGEPYTTAATDLPNVVIFQKSDVKRPGAEENARNGEWTFKEFLESLKAQFNVDYEINSNDVLRIEHVSYFSKTNGLDLTSGSYAARIAGLNAYRYAPGEVPTQEKWEYMETVSQLFTGRPIVYDNCVSDDATEELVSMGPVNNDISFIQANTDLVDDEGFVFANTYASGSNYYLITEQTEFGSEYLLNGHMSIPNLQQNYHRWERPLINGNLNNVDVTFESAIRRKEQVELSIKYDRKNFASFDADQLIKTQLGWGEVLRLQYSTKNETLTLTLKHA